MKDIAVFEACLDGRFIYEDITIKPDGPSAYKIYIGIDNSEDSVYCEVPHVYTLISFLQRLTDKRPVFTSLADSDWVH